MLRRGLSVIAGFLGGLVVGLLAPTGQEIAERVRDRLLPALDRFLPERPVVQFEPFREKDGSILARVTSQGGQAFVFRVLFCPPLSIAAVLPNKEVLRSWRDDCTYNSDAAMEILQRTEAGELEPYCDLEAFLDREVLRIQSDDRDVESGQTITMRLESPGEAWRRPSWPGSPQCD